MRWLFIPSCLALLLAAGPAAAICEIHPNYDSEFRKSLNAALYRVRSTEHLAAIIYRLILIDQEVEAHETAHFNAAEGWADAPVYETVELYEKHYRIGGCVQPKPGIPLEIAYRAALAPKQPSPQDLRVARKISLRMQRR